MTDPLFVPTTPDVPVVRGRRCARHQWGFIHPNDKTPCDVLCVDVIRGCIRCGKPKDEARARRGRSADRLGKDQERRIQRLYGPTKRGQYGDAVDHVGATFKWQSKATRAAVPAWLADLAEHPRLPASITRPLAAMEPIFRELAPLVIRSYVAQGRPTRDYIFLRFRDWFELHGRRPENIAICVVGPEDTALAEAGETYVVMTGATFLDLHGRDEAALHGGTE